jgi:hypothetical protein
MSDHHSSHRPAIWDQAIAALDADGFAVIRGLLAPDACADLTGLFDQPERFRSRIEMARHGFGRGEYRYFEHPLPPLVDALRREAYGPLAGLANLWRARLGDGPCYPDSHDAFLAICREAGQTRPTPLLLRYGPGDFNRLHRDRYGDVFFPIQLAILLDRPGVDFTGGAFVLTETRPRMQSRAIVVPLDQGDAILFAGDDRPVAGKRGWFRARMRHGVATIDSGRRHALGVIFHDAR